MATASIISLTIHISASGANPRRRFAPIKTDVNFGCEFQTNLRTRGVPAITRSASLTCLSQRLRKGRDAGSSDGTSPFSVEGDEVICSEAYWDFIYIPKRHWHSSAARLRV